jgi:hypothetical protein
VAREASCQGTHSLFAKGLIGHLVVKTWCRAQDPNDHQIEKQLQIMDKVNAQVY